VSNDKFSAAVDFDVKSTPYAILIQTDKPIYKPSQTGNTFHIIHMDASIAVGM